MCKLARRVFNWSKTPYKSKITENSVENSICVAASGLSQAWGFAHCHKEGKQMEAKRIEKKNRTVITVGQWLSLSNPDRPLDPNFPRLINVYCDELGSPT